MLKRHLAVLLASGGLLLSSLPALAIEPSAAAQALGDALVRGTGGKASFTGATQQGSDIVVDGLALTSHDSSDTVAFAKTVIASPAEGGAGVFTSPKVDFTDGAITGESAGSLASASISNLTVLPAPAAGSTAPKEPGVIFDLAEALSLSVGPGDKPFKVSVARVAVEMSDVVNNAANASKGSVEQITIPPEAFADMDFKPEMLGYDRMVLGITWDGTRDPAAKTLSIRDFSLLIENGGKLTITGQLGNLPEPSAMQEEQRAAAASEIVVHNATIRFEDQSLTGKILDMQAQKQGVTRDQYAQQIAGALPFLLAALNNPPFQNQVSTALGAFLQAPKSLTIRVAPETPVTGAEILQIVGSAPQTLPDRLKVGVTAND